MGKSRQGCSAVSRAPKVRACPQDEPRRLLDRPNLPMNGGIGDEAWPRHFLQGILYYMVEYAVQSTLQEGLCRLWTKNEPNIYAMIDN